MLSVHQSQPGWLTKALAALIPDATAGRIAALNRDLARAGYYRPHARLEFLALRNLMVFTGVAILLAALYAVADSGPALRGQVLLAGFFVIGAFYIGPRFYLTGVGTRRVQRILDGLPDALDMVTMCVASGLPLNDALQRVKPRIREAHPDLAAELDIVQRQVAIGATEQALRRFAERIDEPDVYALAEVATHAERVGADVGGVLSEYSDNIRHGIRQRAEYRGNMTSVKLLFPIMFCLAPAAYLLLLTPSVVELRQFLIRENQPGGALDVSTAQNVVRRPINDRLPSTPTEQQRQFLLRQQQRQQPNQPPAATLIGS